MSVRRAAFADQANMKLSGYGDVFVSASQSERRSAFGLTATNLGLSLATAVIAGFAGATQHGARASQLILGLALASTVMLVMLGRRFAALAARATGADARLTARDAQVQAFIALQDAIAAALPSRAAVVAVILDFAQAQTGADASALEVVDGDEMVYEAARGALGAFVGMRLQRRGSLSGMCSQAGSLLVCRDTQTDPRVDRRACERTGIRSMIVMPIAGATGITAVLKVASPVAEAFGEAEVRALELTAKNLAGALAAAAEFSTLEESERRYRVLTDVLPQLVGIFDARFRLVYLNERARTYTGTPPAALDSGCAQAVLHPDDVLPAKALRDAVAAGKEFSSELRLRRWDDTYRWHCVRAVPLDERAIAAGQWMLTATDIQDSKHAQAIITANTERLERSAQSERADADALREANRLLLMAEEMAHVGVYRVDLTTGRVFWSDEVYRTHGLPSTFEPTLAAGLERYHPDDRDRITRIVEATLTDGRPFTFESRIIRPDAAVRNVTASGHIERAADGTIVALVGVFQDITAFKDAERERQKLGERYMLATQAGNIGIWEWDIERDAMDWNHAMYSLHGLAAAGEPTSAVWTDWVHPDDRERVDASLRTTLATDEPFDTEFRILAPDGERRHIRAKGAMVRNDPSGRLRMVGTNWDITEIRMLEHDLRAEKERAEHASRAKSEFLARISHEIRTPMNGIIGFTTLVLDGDLSAEQRRHLTLLKDAGKSLLAIINDVLDFSKIEAGKIDLESIAFSPNALVDGALSIVRPEARSKNIALHVDVSPDVPAWVSGDPTRLRQILLNLLTNALKFTERGSVRVRVTCDMTKDRARRLRFEIADTGIGIAPEQRHLLFEDFSQVEKSITRRFGGTGLGLAISKRLVEAMGGDIGVESTLGAGSVFWYTVQLPEIAPPTVAADIAPLRPFVARRILVADDNRVNQIVVDNMLSRDGHQVVIVENGAEAVGAVKTGHYDLVLMDMQMPIMDGIEATRAIRALPEPACNVRIVALTANAMPEEVERCQLAGMNGHLAKPIDRDLLRETIAAWTVAPATVVADEASAQNAARATTAPLTRYADTPTLGIATLMEIFEDDIASVDEIFTAALASIEADLDCIVRSVADRDIETLIEAAHRMKGTSGSIRSQHVIELSTTIELAAKTNPAAVESTHVHALGKAVNELREDLEAHRLEVALGV